MSTRAADAASTPPIAVSGADALERLVERARALASAGGRRILGIAGAPGAGKSTLCSALLARLGSAAVLVGMDGFHLANAELIRLGRRDRKGAPDTFDTDGYLALLRRLRAQTDGVIYAPAFDRTLEESIGSAVAVSSDTPLVITEGNYLLHTGDGWAGVAEHLDESWYVDVDHDERHRRLVARRISHGHPADEAAAWARDVDGANALIVERSIPRADLVVRLPTTAPRAGGLSNDEGTPE